MQLGNTTHITLPLPQLAKINPAAAAVALLGQAKPNPKEQSVMITVRRLGFYSQGDALDAAAILAGEKINNPRISRQQIDCLETRIAEEFESRIVPLLPM